MRHMCTDEMAGGEGTEQGQFAGHNGGSNEAGECLCVLPGVCGVCAFHAQQLQYALLWC
jgi:hypothetical protein